VNVGTRTWTAKWAEGRSSPAGGTNSSDAHSAVAAKPDLTCPWATCSDAHPSNAYQRIRFPCGVGVPQEGPMQGMAPPVVAAPWYPALAPKG
jgi:hypothetical protein